MMFRRKNAVDTISTSLCNSVVRTAVSEEAEAIRKLLRQANSYREAMELLDKHINGLYGGEL